MLHRHLSGCETCDSFARSVEAFTLEFRMTPLVAQKTAVRTEFAGSRSRRSLKVPLAALTSAAAAVLMSSVILQGLPASSAVPSSAPAIAADGPENEVEAIREFRDLSLARPVEQDPPSGQPGLYLG